MTNYSDLLIKQGRHPVIECQLSIGEPYIPNDILSGKELPAVKYANTLKERFSQENMYAGFVESVVKTIKAKVPELDASWGTQIKDIEADYIFVSDIFKDPEFLKSTDKGYII